MSAYKTSGLAKKPPPKPTLDWSTISIGKVTPSLDPATLTQGQRQTLWAGIKRDNPALAEMLSNDPNIAALKQQFNAKIVFDLDEAHSYMTSGKLI
jgi:hypothetical protein